MVSCARATRDLGRPSLDTRSGRPSSPPSREKIENGGRSMRAVEGNRDHSPKGRCIENRKAIALAILARPGKSIAKQSADRAVRQVMSVAPSRAKNGKDILVFLMRKGIIPFRGARRSSPER
jgi:hypothetical protein